MGFDTPDPIPHSGEAASSVLLASDDETKINIERQHTCQCAPCRTTVNMPITIVKSHDDIAAQLETTEVVGAMVAAKPARFISKREVLDRVGASYPSIWQWMREGKFPRSRELGGRAVWVETEIESFIVNRPVRRLKGDK